MTLSLAVTTAFAADAVGVSTRMETVTEASREDGKTVYKLVFGINSPAGIYSASIMFSYDDTLIVPVTNSDGKYGDVANADYATYYTYLFDVLLKTEPLLGEGDPYSIATKGETAYMTQEETNRSAFLVDFFTQTDPIKSMSEPKDALAFYFRLADGKSVEDLAKGTFRIETDKGTGSFLAQYYV